MSSRAEKLDVMGLKERDLPALVLLAIDNRRHRLSSPPAKWRYWLCRALIWLELWGDLPGAVRRFGWRITARYSAMGFASACDVAYSLQEALKELEQQQPPPEWGQQQPDEYAGLFAAITEAFRQVSQPANHMRHQIAALRGSAHRCLAIVIAAQDWATDELPPRLDTPEWEAARRARLLTALSASRASANISSAHGAQEPGTR